MGRWIPNKSAASKAVFGCLDKNCFTKKNLANSIGHCSSHESFADLKINNYYNRNNAYSNYDAVSCTLKIYNYA